MLVKKKQPNSKMCIICGMENDLGLKAPFYEMEDDSVISLFAFREVHQSYPERTHGGLISSMLDEVIGRAIWITEPDAFGVTIELNVKFRKPVPYNQSLKAIGKIIKNTSKIFIGVGEILDNEGNVLAEAKGTYLKMPLSKIGTSIAHEDINIMINDNVTEIKN